MPNNDEPRDNDFNESNENPEEELPEDDIQRILDASDPEKIEAEKKERARQRRLMRLMRYTFGSYTIRTPLGFNRETGEPTFGMIVPYDFKDLAGKPVILINPETIPGYDRDDPNLHLTIEQIVALSREKLNNIGTGPSLLDGFRDVVYTLMYAFRLDPIREEYRRRYGFQTKNTNPDEPDGGENPPEA